MEAEEKALEIIDVITLSDGWSAKKKQFIGENIYKIQEIMIGAGRYRKPIPYTKKFLQPQTHCRAEILKNGKLRII